MSRVVLIIILAVLAAVQVAGQSPKCQDTAWEKVRGMRPESVKNKKVLHTGFDSQGLVATCFQKCKSANCSAFVVDLERSVCLSVEPTDSHEFVFEPNLTFFHRICLKVPQYCLDARLWQVERNLGAFLYDASANVLPEPISRRQCYETCISKADCRSAQFRTSHDLLINDTIGNCALLTIERGTKPQAYRTSMYRHEYLEYQCHNISRRDYCSYAEYRNSTVPFSDLRIYNVTADQCEKRCDDSKDGFLCRAYGYEYNQRTKNSSCYLHSEDTMGTGASTLITQPGSFYKEREPCIDMSVRCTNSSLTIELRTNEPFLGRIYASGYSETCGVQGLGEKITKLVLPLPTDTNNIDAFPVNCGLTPAYSMDQDNQTKAVIWSTVIVQFNPIIQRLGDQAVRVGCSLDSAGEVPGPQNVTVHSSFSFVDPNAGVPPVVSTVMNTSSEVPTVSMNILDAATQDRANVTQLGQKLLLKINVSSNQGVFDIMAGHLTASTDSGHSSILLLDEMGCPVTTVFPALLKDPADNRSLIAEFQAFKFPNSQHVRFNVIVKFCFKHCEPVNCTNAKLQQPLVSYGRRRRSASEYRAANVTEVPADSTMTDELELSREIIVAGNFDPHPNPLRAGNQPDTLVILEPGEMYGKFCMNSSLALLLLILLLIIQIILIGSCVLAVRTYRRLAIRAEEDRADILARHLYGIHGGNFEISRRVRWADNNDSTLS